jgi:hypothetical protein
LPLTYTADVTIPANQNRNILAYCTADGGCGEYIKRVNVSAIDNSSDCGGYEDYTTLNTGILAGQSYPITVTNALINHPEDRCGIWIDWNQNQDFSDDGAIIVSGSPGSGPYTANIVAPANAKNGMTGMRIRLLRNGTPGPCGSTANGEVEDYSLDYISWFTATPMEGTIAPGEVQQIAIDFNSTGLDMGTYQANLNFHSNDPDNPLITVPITLNVSDLALTVYADKDSICLGGSAQLHAIADGGSGTYTYSWTSDPVGFTSNEAEPLVSPEVNTTYYVEMTDGNIVIDKEVAITVLPIPEVNLGPDMEICQGESHTFYAGSGSGYTYLWNTGAQGDSITVSDAGSYMVIATNPSGCAKSDTVVLTVNPLPVVDLGPDQSFCEGTSLSLDAGAGSGYSYSWNTGANTESIDLSQAGTYWVEVTNASSCVASDTIMVSMDPLPGKAAAISGPVSVDNFLNSSSDFTTSGSENANSYEWTLSPENAGSISGTDTTGQVTWTSGYAGPVSVSVQALNDCGAGLSSDVFNLDVYTSQGIGENQSLNNFRIYPNPNEGIFKLDFESLKDQNLEIRIYNNLGKEVYSSIEKVSKGNFNKSIDLGKLPEGTYTLRLISGKDGSRSKQIILLR